jgi:hypothetical protein
MILIIEIAFGVLAGLLLFRHHEYLLSKFTRLLAYLILFVAYIAILGAGIGLIWFLLRLLHPSLPALTLSKIYPMFIVGLAWVAFSVIADLFKREKPRD